MRRPWLRRSGQEASPGGGPRAHRALAANMLTVGETLNTPAARPGPKRALLLLATGLSLLGCGDPTAAAGDAAAHRDLGPENIDLRDGDPDRALTDMQRADAALDAAADAEPDAEPDAAPDAEPDAAPDAAPDGAPDAEPERPPLPIDAPLNANPERLLAGTVEGVVALGGTGGAQLLAVVDGSLWRWSSADARVLGAAPGALRAAAEVAGATVLLFEPGGLHVLSEDGPVVSALGLAGVRDFIAPTPAALLLATDDALWRFAADRLAPLAVAGLQPGPQLLLRAGTWDDAPATFIANGATVFVLRDLDTAPRALALAPLPAALAGLAPLADGTVWAAAGGSAWRHRPNLGFEAETLPDLVETVAGHPAAPDVWWRGAQGLWHSRQGRFRRVEGLDATPAGDLVVLADGALVYSDGEGVVRLPVGRLLALEAPPPGVVLSEPVVLTVAPGSPAEVATVTWQLDARPAVAVAGPPWRFTLEPAGLAPGEHTVTVAVRHLDGEVLTAGWRFVVPPPPPQGPTWVDDVGPIFAANCAGACHGERGNARRLDSVDAWRTQIDAILSALNDERMPLGLDPLDPADIARIEAWRAAGMPEE